MHCIKKKNVRLERIKVVVEDYNNKVFIFYILVKVFKFLNQKYLNAPPSKPILLKDSLFRAP
jgi:hypothetical protein